MELSSKRLILCDLRAEHAEPLNQIERDPRVTRYMTFDPQTLEESQEYVRKAIEAQLAEVRAIYEFAITLRDQGVLIGRCGLGISRPAHKEAAIWYVLHPDHWGNGYARDASVLLLDFAFGVLQLHRVYADCDPRNTASCRLVANLGFILEGTLRQNYYLKGEWCDAAIYGMLAHEWAGRATPAAAGRAE